MKHEAIYNLYPSVKRIVETENGIYTAYDANDNVVSINMSNVNAKAEELNNEYNSKQYQRQRANKYPDFKEYLDGIVKGDDAQIQKYINDCLAVKAKYPKN
jgi:hypothetical protein